MAKYAVVFIRVDFKHLAKKKTNKLFTIFYAKKKTNKSNYQNNLSVPLNILCKNKQQI